MSSPSGWRNTLALVVFGLITLQALIVVITPVLPWLVLGLVGGGGLALAVYVLIRRGTRW